MEKENISGEKPRYIVAPNEIITMETNHSQQQPGGHEVGKGSQGVERGDNN
jgi:hypothetical protein